MTYANFKTAIDATIGGLVGLVTKARHKTANEVIAATLYSAENQEGHTGSGITNTILNGTPVVTGVTFNIFFKKVGNDIRVQGYWQNGSGASIAGNVSVINITNSEYYGSASAYSIVSGRKATGVPLDMNVLGANFKTTNPVANGETIYLDGIYTTNDYA